MKSVKQKLLSIRNILLPVVLIVALSAAGVSGWYFWSVSQSAFDFHLRTLIVLEGRDVSPDEFLLPDKNTEQISVVFRNPLFRPAVGHQDVHLTLTMGMRTVEATASLYVLTVLAEAEHEFGSINSMPDPMRFIVNASVVEGAPMDLRFIEEPMRLKDYPVGEHMLRLSLNGEPFDVLLKVSDTTPPAAEPVNVAIKIGEEVKPEDFVRNIIDASDHLPISITYYGTEPNIFGHNQQIAIKVEDYYGNYSIIQTELSVEHNKTPPVIMGVEEIFSNIGDPILFMQGITAYDDLGRDLTERVTVDSTNVNQNEVGIYTVRYRAMDYTGFSFEIEATVNVINITADFVNERVDGILEDIINDEMTQLEKVRTIFSWVRSHVTYDPLDVNRPETSYEGAYWAIRARRGNYLVFFSISEIMLTRAGVPNEPIDRIPGTTIRHRWNLVNPDDLGWYHFDSFPSSFGVGGEKAFFTDTQAEEFTRQFATLEENPMNNYYTYDPSLYPQIVR
jgi:transglutaminase-like putative cysteine protease